jgi:[ribosomal protein S5]-alanine N-acetyltransferase
MSFMGPPLESLNTHSLETERLAIELPDIADAATLFHLVGGPDRREVCATLLWDGPSEIDEVEDWIDKAASQAFGDHGFHWVLRDKTGRLTRTVGEAIGTIGTRPRGEPGRADVGYWLGRPYWGKGLMGEALRKLIEYGFTGLDYYKIEADVYTHNQRGLRLVEGVGMRREGTMTRAYRKYGEFVDTNIYGLLIEDWESRRP